MNRGLKTRESLKLGLRRALLRANVDVGRDPASRRLARTLASRNISTIIDIGANMGQFAALTRAAGYTGTIHSFEPLPDAYRALLARCAKDPTWFAHNLAVGAERGLLELNVAGNSFSSSVLPMAQAHIDAAPASSYVDRLTVEATTVQEILASARGFDAPQALLKVDTQGYELPVLMGAGPALSDFAAIQVEMSFAPLYEGQVLFDNLRTFIENAGFELFSLQPGISAADGRLLQVDGLFVRT